ncbi:hypothetical protein HYH03_004888 [Edaphochlamys debaryana]|uniref:SCP domain-containing protein n=1 Tax=Edaphochlamys debaryana TaxID=47281 RepID=A0A836C1Z5_9CHLO|nr:hypothetical protein HYH03_004888 [Edaphochlamys debaryana]|eukprot:KAG2497305.1 hypothetical protein HYH03_004888 [Edaphochlamys debaryana]
MHRRQSPRWGHKDTADPSPSPPPPPRRPPRSPSPPRPPPPATASGPLTGGGCDDAQQTLDRVNKYRAAHQALPVAWDPALASQAQAYANTLASRGCDAALSHTGAKGEMLYWEYGGWDGYCRYAISDWYGESAVYSFNDTPFYTNVIMNAGNDFSHFTQLVWRSSTAVGCGTQSSSDGYMSPCNYVVCYFAPGGNMASDAAYLSNVLPATG